MGLRLQAIATLSALLTLLGPISRAGQFDSQQIFEDPRGRPIFNEQVL